MTHGKPVFFKIEVSKVDPNFPVGPEALILSRHDGIFESLTPKLTKAELDGYIDDLIKELEYIRKEGKRKFAKEHQKLRK